MKRLTLSLSSLACSLLCFSFQVVEDRTTTPILSPSISSQKVAKIVLDNGLEAYLISDPNASQSAAALSVEAGSWHDPKEHPGLAHFLEHMLFMGSKRYPIENEHSAFIRDHGGEENAYTFSDRTLYFFAIENSFFLEGLDRFAHFFIDPLFTPSSIERERNAVHEEFQLHKESELWKTWMVIKETGNPDHPNAQFCIGSHESLQNVTQDVLKKWHSENYSADKMHLVLVSPLPIEQLMTETETIFQSIPCSTEAPPSFKNTILNEAQKGHILYLDSDSEGGTLELTWEITEPYLENYVTDLSAAAFKHPLKNSLLHHLKRKNWIHNLDVSFDHVSKDHELFTLELSLTSEGLKNLNETVYATFQALARQKEDGIPPFLHDELNYLNKLTYQYQSREEPFDLVSFHAFNLVEQPLSTYPEQLVSVGDDQASLFKSFVQTLTPESCVYVLKASPQVTGVECDREEKWTKTRYALQSLPSATLKYWKTATPHPAIEYPYPNPYLPHPTLKELSSNPSLMALENSDHALIYFEQDSVHRTPELCTLFSLYSPLLDCSAKSEVLLSLLTRILNHRNPARSYFATEAGISVYYFNDDGKLTLRADGFSDQLPLFLKELFAELPLLTFSEEEFEENKESLFFSLIYVEDAVEIAKLIFREEIFPEGASLDDKLEAFEQLTFADFKTFAANLLQETYIEGVIYGNQTKDEATELWNVLKTSLPRASAYTKPAPLLPEIPEEGTLTISVENEGSGNATMLALYQDAYTLKNRSAQKVLSLALKEPFFDTLRTKQQTGYQVGSWNERIGNELFQFFSVISSQYAPDDLLERFEAFLEDYLENLEEYIPLDRFEVLKKSTIAKMSHPEISIADQASRLHFLLTERDRNFNFAQEGVEAVKNLSYDEFIEYALNALDEARPRIAVLISEKTEDEEG